jgi:hypothetical protein
MKVHIVSYVVICIEFQQVKDENKHLVVLLHPHDIPELKWEVILMDFIVRFHLTTRRHYLIFLVVDTLTKSSHFIPVHTMYNVLGLARVFVREIVRLHGVPINIIFDQGSMFTGWF